MSINGSRKKILIMDDDEGLTSMLEMVLRKEATVETVSNGHDGLRKLHEQNFNLIISDIDMPVMTGIDFYLEARKIDPEIREKLIFFSASNKPETLSFLKEQNLKLIKKPSSLSIIRSMVKNMFSREKAT